MEIGEELDYKGYSIVHPRQDDFITEIGHDSLTDAEEFIDTLLKLHLIVEPEEKPSN